MATDVQLVGKKTKDYTADLGHIRRFAGSKVVQVLQVFKNKE